MLGKYRHIAADLILKYCQFFLNFIPQRQHFFKIRIIYAIIQIRPKVRFALFFIEEENLLDYSQIFIFVYFRHPKILYAIHFVYLLDKLHLYPFILFIPTLYNYYGPILPCLENSDLARLLL